MATPTWQWQQPPAPPPPRQTPPRRPWWRTAWVAAAGTGALGLIIGLTAGAASSSTAKPQAAPTVTVTEHATHTVTVHVTATVTPARPGRYQQTWTASYQNTTCAQWSNQMDDHQRFVAAHDMIIAMKAKDTSDSFADTFVGAVTKACGVPSMDIASVAAGIATLDTTDFN